MVQGGSSLTQQVAKNLFLSPERTIRRKVHEAFLSLWIEARKSKQEILKLYLDRSYLGGGNYGVEAAAQFYFGKSIRDVNLSEAAMLAGLFKAPSKYAPHQNMEVAKARANVVLYRMLDAGFITQGELLQARREPPPVIAQRSPRQPRLVPRLGLRANHRAPRRATPAQRLRDRGQDHDRREAADGRAEHHQRCASTRKGRATASPRRPP